MGGIHDRDVWRLKLTHFCHSSRWQTMKERIIGEDIIWRALEVTLADNLVSKANIGVAFVTFWWRLHGQRHLASLFFIYWCNNETENEQKLEKAIFKTQDGANLKNKNLAKQGKITLVPDNCYPITIGGVGHKAYKL